MRHTSVYHGCHLAGLAAHSGFRWQLGDVATWVGGIATAIALILTWLLLLLTRREQRETREEKRRAQAQLISAWADPVAVTHADRPQDVTVNIQNLSEQPVYGVRAAVGTSWDRGEASVNELGLVFVIPPKSTPKQTVSMLLIPPPDGGESQLPVEIIFYDASHGRLWHRDLAGWLRQIPDGDSGSAATHFFRKPG